jgi:hypothetical protein
MGADKSGVEAVYLGSRNFLDAPSVEDPVATMRTSG